MHHLYRGLWEPGTSAQLEPWFVGPSMSAPLVSWFVGPSMSAPLVSWFVGAWYECTTCTVVCEGLV